MVSRRFVLVVTDAAGRHRGRVTVSVGHLRRLVAVAIAVASCVMLLVVHTVMVREQRRTAVGLTDRNETMTTLVRTLEQQKAAVQASVSENRRALALLSRKSHLVGLHDAPAQEDAPEAIDQEQPKETSARAWHEPANGEALVLRTDALLAQGQDLEGSLTDLLEFWRDAEQRLTYTPSIRPARSPWTTSSYGVRIDPVFHYWVMHKGLDLGGFIGMLVYAPADGIVVWTGTRGGYGQVVVIDHGMGLQTHYAHLSKYLVRKGDMVKRGDPIAEMGTTGKSTGPHLHYEVRQDGVPMDPRLFILD